MTEVAEGPLSARHANLLRRLEVENFLYHEAQLIDARRFDEWLALFSDDYQWRVPLVENLQHTQIASEYLLNSLDVSWIDEDKAVLATRVAQIKTGVHWAEEPLSRTTHIVTNVQVSDSGKIGEINVDSRFLVYRSRNSDEQDVVIGKRNDILRRSGESWLFARRTVYLDQPVLLTKTLSFFV